MLLPQRLAAAELVYGNGFFSNGLLGDGGRWDIVCRNRCLKHFARACGWFAAFNGVDKLHARCHAAKDGIFVVEAEARLKADEELIAKFKEII